MYRQIYVNQGYRDFNELAQIKDKGVLIEYEMPNGTSALKVVPLEHYNEYNNLTGWRCKNIAYSKIPQYWVEALVQEGTQDDLYFYPQQASWEKLQAYKDRFEQQIAKAREKLGMR